MRLKLNVVVGGARMTGASSGGPLQQLRRRHRLINHHTGDSALRFGRFGFLPPAKYVIRLGCHHCDQPLGRTKMSEKIKMPTPNSNAQTTHYALFYSLYAAWMLSTWPYSTTIVSF